MEIKNVGVVGRGIMGSGVAQVWAQLGYQVVVSEVSDELLDKGLASINSFLTKGRKKGKISQQDKNTILRRITGTTDFKDFYNCGIVVEAITEKIELKKEIFARSLWENQCGVNCFPTFLREKLKIA